MRGQRLKYNIWQESALIFNDLLCRTVVTLQIQLSIVPATEPLNWRAPFALQQLFLQSWLGAELGNIYMGFICSWHMEQVCWDAPVALGRVVSLQQSWRSASHPLPALASFFSPGFFCNASFWHLPDSLPNPHIWVIPDSNTDIRLQLFFWKVNYYFFFFVSINVPSAANKQTSQSGLYCTDTHVSGSSHLWGSWWGAVL